MRPKVFITFVLAATLLGACDRSHDPEVMWSGEILLSSGVTAHTRVNDANVPDKQIANGQKVQIVVTKQATDADAYDGYNQALTAQGDGTFSGGAKMYYPLNGSGVSIYAYHPAKAGASFFTHPDQTFDPNYFDSDLLYAAKADYDCQVEAHSLTFDHQLCKLIYTLKSGTGSPDIAGATVKWTNVCNTANFDATTGAVTLPTNPTTITPHATHGAIVVPQTVEAHRQLLEITLANGNVLKYTPDADQRLEGKKKCHYEITVSLTGLAVESTITDWEPVADRTGEAIM